MRGEGLHLLETTLNLVGRAPDAEQRVWAFGLSTGLAASVGNNLTYDRVRPDAERRVLNIPIEWYFDRQFDRAEVGVFTGVHLFRGGPGSTVVPNFWKGVAGLRGSYAIVRLGETGSKWASLRLRGGLTWFPRGFDVSDFGAIGNWSAGTAGADCHLGYTYGRPVVSKLADGTWVVMVTSGYNNINATAKAGDGEGYLYVLNAATGRIIYKISTGAGSPSTPSGSKKHSGG